VHFFYYRKMYKIFINYRYSIYIIIRERDRGTNCFYLSVRNEQQRKGDQAISEREIISKRHYSGG